MIKLKDLLQEAIYGNQSTVYHRTSVNDLADKIYATGFRVGDGNMYGYGFYSTYDESSQNMPKMSTIYGPVVLKCAINLTDFFFFDWSEFIKTPLYKYKLNTSTEDTFIRDQIAYYKINMWRKFHNKSVNYTSELALFVYENSDLTKKVAGIVFTGSRDGRVLVCYDVKRIRPLAYKKDGEDWVKGELTKDFIDKSTAQKIKSASELSGKEKIEYLIMHSGYQSITNNGDGTFDIGEDIDLNMDWNGYGTPKEFLQGIHNVEGSVVATHLNLNSLKNFPTGVIEGNVDLSYNMLTSLANVGKEVQGKVLVSYNKIKTLRGCNSIMHTLIIDHNKLEDLQGLSDEIKVLDCHMNPLESLEGCPKIMERLNCSLTRITSFKGGPEIITGSLTAMGTSLKSLEGFPKEVGGNVMIHSSDFTEADIRAICNVKGKVS
jgi:hypothetical protein